MALNNPVLPWLVGVAAVFVFILVVLGWPYWRQRYVGAAARAVKALVLNGLIIVLCFLLLNNEYLFYTSWSDMLSSGQQHTTISQGQPASDAAAGKVRGPGLAHVSGPHSYGLPNPGQRMQNYTVRAPASKARMQVLVYLPVGYNPSSSRLYPVIVGLHGYPGVPKSFAQINFLTVADKLEAAGKLRPSIFVIPQINDPKSLDTECVNGPDGSPQTETWLSKELLRWVIAHFHVHTNRQSWATLGYSFGGWCAASLTIRHPDVFSAAICFAGYFQPQFSKTYRPLTITQLKEHDLIRRVRVDPPPVAVWLFSSRQDSSSFPTSYRFMRAARPPTSVTATFTPVGGHRNAVFEPFTAAALTWLAQSTTGFRP